ELGTVMFIIPGWFVKNGDARLVVLNEVARSVIAARGAAPDTRVCFQRQTSAADVERRWLRARERAGRNSVRVHDLKHTFGRRLRARACARNALRACESNVTPSS